MNAQILKSKIHKARLTACDLHYEGSLAIDQDIMDACGMLPYEKILVVNATNGQRLETYAIVGERGSKIFCLNGAAARLGERGDMVTIMSFGSCPIEECPNMKPTVVVLNEKNDIIKKK